jgi:hypothetical protein
MFEDEENLLNDVNEGDQFIDFDNKISKHVSPVKQHKKNI